MVIKTEAAARAANPQREIVLSLVINAIVPIAVFYGLRALGVDQWTALLLGLVGPAVKTLHSVITKRRIDQLAALVMTALLLSVALSFLTGSPRLRDLTCASGCLSAGWGCAARSLSSSRCSR